MNIAAITESFTQVEIFSLVVAALVVGVLFGPGAISVEGADSTWVEALSATLVGLITFAAGAISLWAAKR